MQDQKQNLEKPKNKIFSKIHIILFLFIALNFVALTILYCVIGSKLKSNNFSGNKILKVVNKEIENYYDILEKKCNDDSCCLDSVKAMRKNNYEEADENRTCQEEFEPNGLWCEKSLTWCQPIEKEIDDEIIDISDWQTYQNEKYGFEVKYPLPLVLSTDIIEEKKGTEEYMIKFSEPKDEYSISVRVYNNPYESENIYYREMDKAMQDINNEAKDSMRFIQIENQKWVEIWGYPGLYYNTELSIPSKEKIYEFDLSAKGFFENLDSKPEDIKSMRALENFKLMLSTFKFTDQDKIIKPSKTDCKDKMDMDCWMIYQNEEHGFELKYPHRFGDIGENKSPFCNGVWFKDKETEFQDKEILTLSRGDEILELQYVNNIIMFEVFASPVSIEYDRCVEGHYNPVGSVDGESYEFLGSTIVNIKNKAFLRRDYKDIVPSVVATGYSGEYRGFEFSSWNIEHKDKLYTLLYNNRVDANSENYHEQFEQILSTFKFTN